MSDHLSSFLASSMIINGGLRLVMMLPLCLSIAIVYKTTRCEDLRELPMAVGGLLVSIVLGMAAVGIGLWLLFQIMV